MMKIVSWDIIGIESVAKKQPFKRKISMGKPDLVFIQESKLDHKNGRSWKMGLASSSWPLHQNCWKEWRSDHLVQPKPLKGALIIYLCILAHLKGLTDSLEPLFLPNKCL